ncbi:hypothetical protein GWK47_023596 [Chionoecetes opilio]|uniref:Uncharacterized protein n=1 Tax=Chionoecetes opilio TaxID=41210 RepID=A0A8J4XP78_CHIOP|nr:hypothetical protein GWK47_023596 [Chionoecetes opilio]
MTVKFDSILQILERAMPFHPAPFNLLVLSLISSYCRRNGQVWAGVVIYEWASPAPPPGAVVKSDALGLKLPAGDAEQTPSIHPLFKVPVVLLLNPETVDAVISRLLFEVTEQAVLDISEGSSPDEDEEEKFSSCGETILPGVGHHEGQESEYMTSDNFERVVFMKGNMDLLKMELSPEDSE